MILTGKAKEDFEKWYNDTIGKEISVGHMSMYTLHSSMINSLIIDWFDSVGIYINVEIDYLHLLWFPTIDNKWIYEEVVFSSRTEAIKYSISKANEMYNIIKK